ELSADGRGASPALLEPHIHLDKVMVWPLLPPNRAGTLGGAIEILHRTKAFSSPEEVAERAGKVIRQAVLSGITQLRSHVDVDTIGGLRPLPGVLHAPTQHADPRDIPNVTLPAAGS